MFKSEKGASAVEFAIVAPLLFVLTFGIIEFGVLLFDKAVITNASREGARAAVVHTHIPLDPEELQTFVEDVVEEYADAYLISLGSASTPTVDSISYTTGTFNGITSTDINITVRYNYTFLVFQTLIGLLSGGEWDDNIPLVGRTVMRMEGS